MAITGVQMNNSDYDSLDGAYDYEQRLEAEWTAVSALREVVGIALKGTVRPTYVQTLALAQNLLPRLFDQDRSLLFRRQESTTTRRYRQMADAQSELEGERVTALELVERDIARYEEFVEVGPERDQLRKELHLLYRARQELRPRAYSEQQLILRDVFKVDRRLPVSDEGRDYREYEVPNDRRLRLRILHPDQPEHSMGADVIYEHYWDKKTMVRLAAIQYKVWEGKALYRGKMAKQLERFRKTFCDNALCEPFEESQRKHAYRLPFCAAFLRPTDKLQDPDSRLISSGYHVPVCVIERLWEDTQRGGQKLVSGRFRSEAVTYRVFEELFNTNMLGSKWLTYEELEELYHEHGILEPDEHIVIHAQEFGI